VPEHPQHDLLRAQRAVAQATLPDFLRVDLELAFIILEMIEATENTEPYRYLIEMVCLAVATVREALERTKSGSAWQEINARADELEAALSRFSK
jgi:hypothetical protein